MACHVATHFCGRETRSPISLLKILDGLLLVCYQLLEGGNIVLLFFLPIINLLLLVVAGGFELLNGFDQRGKQIVIGHVIGAFRIVLADDKGKAMRRIRFFDHVAQR